MKTLIETPSHVAVLDLQTEKYGKLWHGERMATVSEDGDSMMMLDESRRRITVVDLKSKGKTPPKEIQVSLQSEVDQVCLSAGGKHLITLERNAPAVNVWRASDGTWEREFAFSGVWPTVQFTGGMSMHSQRMPIWRVWMCLLAPRWRAARHPPHT